MSANLVGLKASNSFSGKPIHPKRMFKSCMHCSRVNHISETWNILSTATYIAKAWKGIEMVINIQCRNLGQNK